MPSFVIDACAMIAYLEDEVGADVVEGILVDPDNTCIAHMANVIEVYKYYIKGKTEAAADEAVRLLREESGGLRLRNDLDPDGHFWKSVGKHWGKITSTVANPATGRCYSVSFADCFAIALAVLEKATIVTSDWTEFEPVDNLGIAPVRFFRPKGAYGPRAAGS